MVLTPEIRGATRIRSAPAEFLQAFRHRVSSGLLSGRPHPRSNYVITQAGPDRLQFRAADWWTALNVGLNEVELQPEQGTVHYHIRYFRWAKYVLALSGGLGLVGIILLLATDARGYIARSPGMPPGLTVDQYLFFAWAMVVFWGFVWPLLLIVLHKRPLHRLITRLITEVDARSSSA
jgi:hypothetical protein